MGLDMYLLNNERSEGFNFDSESMGYWRKANHIHAWFVKNVQNGNDDCNFYEVTKEKAEELLNTCKKVLESVEMIDGEVVNGSEATAEGMKPIIEKGKVSKDSSVAEELLPTQEGFFFGGTDYDEYYYDDIKRTIEILENALKDFDFENNRLVYTSSW